MTKISAIKLLKIAFDPPKDGWIGVELRYGSSELKFAASYTPIDSIFELITAIAAVKTHREAKVLWHLHSESAFLEFHFVLQPEDITRLRVEEYRDDAIIQGNETLIFEAEDTTNHLCLIFWRAIKKLESSFSTTEYEARWHHRFPSEAFQRLSQQIKAEG